IFYSEEEIVVKATVFEAGGYRYVPSGVLQYSGGVAAQPGYTIRRVVFSEPVPGKEGFARIQKMREAEGRPLTAICACELRSRAIARETGLSSCNVEYVQSWRKRNIRAAVTNHVAPRTAPPAVNPPTEPSFYAFSYTVPCDTDEHTFVVAGSSEAPEGKGN